MSSAPSSSTNPPPEGERKRRPENIDVVTGKRMLWRSYTNPYTHQVITIDYITGQRTVKTYPSGK